MIFEGKKMEWHQAQQVAHSMYTLNYTVFFWGGRTIWEQK